MARKTAKMLGTTGEQLQKWGKAVAAGGEEGLNLWGHRCFGVLKKCCHYGNTFLLYKFLI